VNNKKLF